MGKRTLSIVIPVYNNSGTVRELYRRLSAVLGQNGMEWDVIFVNDGSKDESWKVLTGLQQEMGNVRVIDLGRNFGQHNATVCGLKYSRGDYIVTMDADLQHPAEEIPKLIHKIEEGYEVVYGVYERKMHSFVRNRMSNLVYAISKRAMNIEHNLSSFRIMKREIADSISRSANYDIILDIIIGWVTDKIGYTAVTHQASGQTSYGLFKLITLGFDFLFNFTVLPLRIASISGALISTFGLVLGVYFVIQRVTGTTDVSGFTAIIVSVLFFSGLILISIGVIGEYLARIYLKLNSKPQYVVKEMRGFKNE
jgi:undecaprenyl-phosphate 4-deoxy-4-formamido-L-arabinose transferase